MSYYTRPVTSTLVTPLNVYIFIKFVVYYAFFMYLGCTSDDGE